MSDYLENKPEEKILFCISPPAAKHFGILPIGLSDDEKTLHIVSNKVLEQEVLRTLKIDVRKRIVIDEIVNPEKFDKAYNLFYQDFLHYK
jgi:hypothetical protein